ncbi:DUF4355 domain-containing protein [Rossellomorea vietnamensis]|uniref:DUF4355 domain-containing protein n=1 Tax=Rossellomorea vietnamensis TaxID=218284 RepID=A0ACD4C755_9BACI|nr:DUF4355 domain-containing protein [Rossellomorea vietnamensis]UXH44450.1 DUF4355 domain-containing protein [Rossellomorea vietnamensis]
MTGPINVFNPAAFKKQFEPLKLNLQYFAESNEPPVDPPNPDDPPNDPPAKVELSAEELQKKIEAESDRKLAKALDKKQKEWEIQLDQKLADAKKDAEQYAKLTQKEKEDADYKKRLEALDKRERELNTKQLRSEVETDLKDEGLPAGFAESLIKLENNEKIKEAVSSIKKEFDAAVNNAVKEMLRQDPPETGGSKVNNSITTSKAEMARKNRIIK